MIGYIIFSILIFLFFGKSAHSLITVKNPQHNLEDYKTGKKNDLIGRIWFAGPNGWAQSTLIKMFGEKLLSYNLKLLGFLCIFVCIAPVLSILFYGGF
jgi:hypothetical protein